MKRDMDLVRKILLAMEETETIKVDGYETALVVGHAKIMIEAGLIAGSFKSTNTGDFVLPTHLTWEGHDFLDACRDESRWQSAKAKIADVGFSISFEVWKALLLQLAKDKLGLTG